jgi:hypothetical protein
VSTLPTVGVCGFGRCGSTMVMAMLAAGGIPTVPGADPHSHEQIAGPSSLASIPRDALPGRAVKLLDAVLYPDRAPLPVPPGGWLFLWLDRDAKEQAKSFAKFLKLTGITNLFPEDIARVRRSYRRDRPRALAGLRAIGVVRTDDYEMALWNPRTFTRHLAEFLAGGGLTLNRDAAAAVIHRRTPKCAPGLDFESSCSEQVAP